MGQAIDELFKGLDKSMTSTPSPRGVLTVTHDLGLVIDAAREVRELQAQHECQKTNIRYLADRGDEAAEHIRALEDALARKSFEVQILQMTQGVLKMEIDRLRSAPKIAATGAEMVISSNGAIVIKADCLSVNGDVVPA